MPLQPEGPTVSQHGQPVQGEVTLQLFSLLRWLHLESSSGLSSFGCFNAERTSDCWIVTKVGGGLRVPPYKEQLRWWLGLLSLQKRTLQSEPITVYTSVRKAVRSTC